MSENSSIEWTHASWNGWLGCSEVAGHPGCGHCYAREMFQNRLKVVKWGLHGTRKRTSDANWKLPIRWNKKAEKEGVRKRVFAFPDADVFEDWQGPVLDHHGKCIVKSCTTSQGYESYYENAIPSDRRKVRLDDLRRDLFTLIDATPHLDWLLLTKRPDNVRRMWPTHWQAATGVDGAHESPRRLDNVWLGCSVSDQATADEAIPHLLKCRDLSPCLFVSYEPALGPVDFTYPTIYFPDGPRICCNGHECGCMGLPVDPPPWFWPKGQGIDWLICGGESGSHARPFDVAWARSARDQCRAAGVPYFLKQLGAQPYDSDPQMSLSELDAARGGSYLLGGDKPNRRVLGVKIDLQDSHGGDESEWPEDLQNCREFPRA